jgi:hypothetical protein
VISTCHAGKYNNRLFFETRGVPFNGFNMIGDCLIWFLPQTLWITDENEDILVDEMLRYETLEDDWRRFSKKFGIDSALVQHNVSKRRRDYRSYYSSRSREVVYEYFREDFEAFDYTFY